MSTARTIAKSSIVLLIGQIASLGIAAAYGIALARYLGVTGFGLLSTAIAFTTVFAPFTSLGLSTLATREVARDKSLASKYLGNLIIIEIALAGATFCLIALVAYALRYPPETITLIYVLALSVACGGFTAIFYSLFQAFERMEYQSLGLILSTGATFLVVIWGITAGLGVVWFAFAYFVGSLAVTIYSLIIYSTKFSQPHFEIDLKFWKRILPEALPFALSGLFTTIYFYIDSVLLSVMKGADAVGWYNAPYRLIMVLLFVPTVISTAVFPAMSRFHATANDSYRLIYKRYFKYMAIVSVPLGVGTTLLAGQIITLIFGVAYGNSVIALQILIWATVFIFLTAAFLRLFETSNRQMIVTKITAVGMIENVTLDLILIPRFSYVGTSIATAVTELTVLLLCVFVSSRITYPLSKKDVGNLVKIGAASLLMGLLIVYLQNLNLLAVFPAVVLYFTMLYLLCAVDNEDIALFRNIARGG
ncbi:MAG TPA: flippase [Candidatus Bathyarchaeia archaeon]|nr:flippase [Candidatus Bathyarchaeia archaeon]